MGQVTCSFLILRPITTQVATSDIRMGLTPWKKWCRRGQHIFECADGCHSFLYILEYGTSMDIIHNKLFNPVLNCTRSFKMSDTKTKRFPQGSMASGHRNSCREQHLLVRDVARALNFGISRGRMIRGADDKYQAWY